jgi:hypothetical protein
MMTWRKKSDAIKYKKSARPIASERDKAFAVRNPPLARIIQLLLLVFEQSFKSLPLTTHLLHRNFSLSARHL